MWKLLDHPNVAKPLGVSDKSSNFCIISDWRKNGNILEYIKKNERANRLKLVGNPRLFLQTLRFNLL